MGNPALAGLPPLPAAVGADLIDWETALPERLARLRGVFAGLDAGMRVRISAQNAAQGEALQKHAVFDALYCHFSKSGARGWPDWPSAYHDPAAPAVSEFAADHEEEVAFHLFAQWLARESLADVQNAAIDAGMRIGLIGDLAIGVDPRGSDAWSMRGAMLRGLTIGAPPDPLGPLGQNWGLTGFSPDGLRNSGYAPFIAMLRAGLAHAGGLRIDHAFGLARLWVIPEGQNSGQGAYLQYPFEDLIRLVTLEAYLADGLIIAEDLGTSPPGFTQAISDRQMLGMRVMWFERAADDGFIGAPDYPHLSVAMTGTHDTATVAGWWTGHDLAVAEALGRLPEGGGRAQAEAVRAWDRGLLWSTIGDGGERPADDTPDRVVDASLTHLARSSACLAIAPLEDILGVAEQPNLPGTVSEYPNWRRRLDAPLEELLEAPANARRVGKLADGRR